MLQRLLYVTFWCLDESASSTFGDLFLLFAVSANIRCCSYMYSRKTFTPGAGCGWDRIAFTSGRDKIVVEILHPVVAVESLSLVVDIPCLTHP